MQNARIGPGGAATKVIPRANFHIACSDSELYAPRHCGGLGDTPASPAGPLYEVSLSYSVSVASVSLEIR